MPHKRNNNQNRHSEGGTTAETLSKYLKIPRCALDDVNMETTTTTTTTTTMKHLLKTRT
jgi:hypothetical protein